MEDLGRQFGSDLYEAEVRYLIEQELAADRLRVVFDRPMQTENSYYLVVPEGKLENPVSQAFREWIVKKVG